MLLVFKHSDFNGEVLSGDGIQNINEKKFGYSSKILDYIQSIEVGEEVEIEVQR